jgi:phage protein D
MKAKFNLGLLFASLALAGMTSAQAATDTPAKPAAAKPAPAKPAAAKAAPAAASLSAGQISTAERVLTGKVQCEFDQAVDVAAVNGKAGHFNVGFKGKTYTMVPEATTTGAIRLEDKKNGMMWLQIANKSMLMNTKAGQRMVDNCQHPSQKT